VKVASFTLPVLLFTLHSSHFTLQRRAQRFAQRLEPLLPDDVDLGVVGDRLEGDVRDALVDEAVTDVVADRL